VSESVNLMSELCFYSRIIATICSIFRAVGVVVSVSANEQNMVFIDKVVV